MPRDYSSLDRALMRLHAVVQSFNSPAPAGQPSDPAAEAPEANLDEAQRRHAAGLMRVNHAGEVAAQALYRGQAATAQDPALREHMLAAAAGEQAHLEWCRRRLAELGESPSRLDPLWYAGSFAIGAAAGALGDKWNLGFLAETERQVELHLEGHLARLPKTDQKSRAIVEQMCADEARHARSARQHGGAELPAPVKAAMQASSKVMTGASFLL